MSFLYRLITLDGSVVAVLLPVGIALGSCHTIFQQILPRRGSAVQECLRKCDRSVEKTHPGLHQNPAGGKQNNEQIAAILHILVQQADTFFESDGVST